MIMIMMILLAVLIKIIMIMMIMMITLMIIMMVKNNNTDENGDNGNNDDYSMMIFQIIFFGESLMKNLTNFLMKNFLLFIHIYVHGPRYALLIVFFISIIPCFVFLFGFAFLFVSFLTCLCFIFETLVLARRVL